MSWPEVEADAKEAIDLLNQIMFGDDGDVVTNSNGVQKGTIDTRLSDMFALILSMVQGRLAFNTKAEMDQVVPTVPVGQTTVAAEVLHDDVEDNNRLYAWSGASWLPSEFDVRAYFNGILDSTSNTERSGYAYVITDESGRIGFGLTPEGRVVFGELSDVEAIIKDLSSRVSELENITQDDLEFERSGYVYALLDENKRMAFGVTRAGDVFYKDGLLSELTGRLPELAEVTSLDSAFDRSGYVYALLDENKRMAFGVTRSGDLLYKGVLLSDIFASLPTASSQQLLTDAFELGSSVNLVTVGDSLTQGTGSSSYSNTYPSKLSSLLGSGRSVTNRGLGGQDSAQITARIGAYCALLTVDGGEIPASGSVDISEFSVSVLYNASGSGSLDGELAGVYGTLSWSSNQYTFTRQDAGSVVAVYPDTPFIPDRSDDEDKLFVFWLGRNDFSTTTDNADVPDMAEGLYQNVIHCVDHLQQLNKRFVVLGVTPSDDSSEYIGTVKQEYRRGLANKLAAKFPNSFIDIENILKAAGDSSSEDSQDVVNGVIPSSLRADSMHLNDAGYELVAQSVYNLITKNGW